MSAAAPRTRAALRQSERPALPVSRTRAARRAVRPKPMARDEHLRLQKLEHEITLALAERARLEHCEQLSRYLDAVDESERLEALCAAGEVRS